MMAWILSASVCAIMYLEGGGVSGNVRSPRGKLRGAPPQGVVHARTRPRTGT